MQLAQASRPTTFSRSTALSTCFWFPKAFQTHLRTFFRGVTLQNIFAALATFSSVAFSSPFRLIVVRTKSSSDCHFVTKFTWFLGMMKLLMVGVITAKNKICGVVVVAGMIQMMHNFLRLQKTTNLVLHYKTVLKHVSSAVAMWVIWNKDQHISLAMLVFTAFPSWVFRSPFGRVIEHIQSMTRVGFNARLNCY
jgi:hypothetical protein